MRRSFWKSPSGRGLAPAAPVLFATLVLGAVLTGAPSAQTGAARQNTTPPTISGPANQGSTLTGTSGTWTFAPTSITYQWQRCDSDGTNCNDVGGATSSNYTLVAADVSHTIQLDVTASNIGNVNDATSDPTSVIASTNGPGNGVPPAISGTTQVGQSLSVSNGTWNPAASAFSYQWQLCAGDGSDCLNIPGGTKSTFPVTNDDVSHTLRALVTAQTSGGDSATAVSNTTGKAFAAGKATTTTTTATTTTTTTSGTTPTTTSTATTTTTATQPFTLAALSLRRSGTRIYASFHVCDDRSGPVTILERDTKGKASPKTHSISGTVGTCANLNASWPLLARFRGAGRFVVKAQARDQTGALSKSVSRSLVFH